MKIAQRVICVILVILLLTGIKNSFEKKPDRAQLSKSVGLLGTGAASDWKGLNLKRYRSRTLALPMSLGEVTTKLHETMPSLKLDSVTIDVAIEKLSQLSKEQSPSGRGLTMLIDERKISVAAPDSLTQKVSLDMSEFPLKQALGHVTAALDLRYRIESHAIVVVPISDRDDPPAIFTRRYIVPPTVQTVDGNAVDILSNKGISFEDSATAFYIPSTSELVVRNTQSQLDVVDRLVENLVEDGIPKEIKVGGL